MSFCPEQLYSQCDKLVWSGVLFLSELGLFQTSPTCYNYSQFRARHCSLMFFFLSLFPLSQLQHCLPVYLLLPRAHSQSSGGTQHHEPPPAPHHEVSGPAPSGCPWALFPWTEGCTQAPFWQGEAAVKPFICNHFHLTYLFIPLYIKLLQYTKHRYVVPNDFYLRNESPIY